jgi:hypothetical protein
MKQNAFENIRPQWPLASARFLWAATVDTEGFSSADRANGLPFA